MDHKPPIGSRKATRPGTRAPTKPRARARQTGPRSDTGSHNQQHRQQGGDAQPPGRFTRCQTSDPDLPERD